jgi:5-methylcytosine-specific restriction enzyme A
MFNPGLNISDVIDNHDLCSIFKCSPQGGMRRSLRTNSLVVISDHTKDFYGDKWNGSILHYVGMGLVGDQKIDFHQNKTLAASQTNGISVHLFEVLKVGKYTYRGKVMLADKPFREKQKDMEENNRLVWIFPLKVAP